MVDVMVSPGDPGPWHRQKEIPLLSGFISAQIPLNLKRPFPFEHSGGKQNTVFDSASPRHSKRHLTTHREPTQPTSRERSEMSHPSLSINHSSIMEDNLCYSLEHVERPRSYADFMNGSVMKRTASSSSHSSLRMTHNSLDQTYAPPMVATVDTYGGFVSYANWAKTPSFASCTEQSPSLSSSFDFTDAATDEPSVPNGLPFTKAGTVTDKALPFQSTNFQFGDSHTSESGLATPWLPWPTSEAELSSQPYFPDNVIEAQNWTNAPPLDNCWSGTEYPISTRSATIPGSNLGFLESASPTPQQDDHTNSPINPIPHYQYHLTPRYTAQPSSTKPSARQHSTHATDPSRRQPLHRAVGPRNISRVLVFPSQFLKMGL